MGHRAATLVHGVRLAVLAAGALVCATACAAGPRPVAPVRPVGAPTTWIVEQRGLEQWLQGVKCDGPAGGWVLRRSTSYDGHRRRTVLRFVLDPVTLQGLYVELGRHASWLGRAAVVERGGRPHLELSAGLPTVAGASARPGPGLLPVLRTAGVCP